MIKTGRLFSLAAFFILATGCSLFDSNNENKANGESLYQNNCARCHGFDAMGTDVGEDTAPAIQGRSVDDLRDAIVAVDEMIFLQQNNFTDKQLDAISDYLLDLLLVTGSLYANDIHGRAYGAAALGFEVLTIKDARGNVYHTQTDEHGYFSFASGLLQRPFMLQLRSSASSRIFHSYTANTGLVNINPLTDIIFRGAMGDSSPQDIFSSCNTKTCMEAVNSETLEQARQNLAGKLADDLVLAEMTTETFQPLKTPMADGAGLVQLITSLETARVLHCSNPTNPHGYVFADDLDGDCYADTKTTD